MFFMATFSAECQIQNYLI